jgi:quinol-cytochrome oxidoreductase complex cytochrome b subunit
VATPASPIAPPLESGAIERKGTAELTTPAPVVENCCACVYPDINTNAVKMIRNKRFILFNFICFVIKMLSKIE